MPTSIGTAAIYGLRDGEFADEAPTNATFNARLRAALTAPPEALAVVDFWRKAGADLWFAKDSEFDRRFRERFLSWHEAAARGELAH